MGRRIKPYCLGSFNHLAESQRNSLSQRIMEFAGSLSPYDTLEFNFGDQKFILYRLKGNIFLATLNCAWLDPQGIEAVIPLIREQQNL